MIFITVKFTVRPEHSEDWLDLVDGFTRATRQEPGNLFFEWSRSVDNPHQFVLVEAFRDSEAGRAHVESEHFGAAMDAMSYAIAETPQIVSTEIADSDGWGRMGELSPREPGGA
ncbi:putative quinol monooxygenase [Streptomyces pathocidini]|uniref:Quinol monooxygenase n=1 Tax=Streptomyces pathocidini TaxID=1650571 RepID=A0ABW7UWJ9_9ACTN|nr:putative quinol monooxygenase [Streptomyces pathocidini]